ncbi:tRNA dihydrouridine synthase [Salinibius halmophilus]|uniref:tRNA dihydrouridine synthase n=1 Tax=Salinibius halmophilus TaxID=1853216 RepID=UPI00131476D3|nr:tRNA-dihydrouridine synthase [Salinibius halmophilus]
MIYLAPMEGLADYTLRQILSETSQFDMLVSEFVRVVDLVLPAKVFRRNCPELFNQARTENGTPVRIQLLGNHPEIMARNAKKAISLGSQGIDLNFGCPSKTVNKSCGGAVLLKTPEVMYEVAARVRDTVDPQHKVTAKMRLGFDDDQNAEVIAQHLDRAGVDTITVHARTKTQGYKPPVYWQRINDVRKSVNCNVVANGDIWTPEDYDNCRQLSGCSDVMIGRGAVRNPLLVNQIRDRSTSNLSNEQLLALLQKMIDRLLANQMPERYIAGRIKQWLSHMVQHQSTLEPLYSQIKPLRHYQDIQRLIG